ncbi:MAG: DUF3857 domain-containing protein [Bacteroidales bacterium]|nr:DUF3857 domain-containing protein [Bacteroidales bacterium]
MRCFSFLFIFILYISSINAQDSPREFGKIPGEELEMTTYALDKSAGAVVLYDLGKSEFIHTDDGFEVLFERTTRIKILNQTGIRWAEIEIPFYREGNIFEKIFDLKAFTYNVENGKRQVTELNKEDYHDEKVNEFWYSRKFAMPDVKDGSVIELRYSIRSQYLFNLRDWEFQWRIPVVYSEYQVKMIPFYEYSWILQGATKFTQQNSFQEPGNARQLGSVSYYNLVHKYVMKNVAAFGDEEFITSYNDYVMKIDFQLDKINYPSGGSLQILTTWPEMIKDLLKNNDFGKFAKKSEKEADDLFNLPVLMTLSPQTRFDTIISFVKANFNWNKTKSKYARKSVSELVKDKFGNSAEINLFTVGLLNAAGIEAYPLLVSTRENGRIKSDFPFLHFFDYVVIAATIEGKTVLSDATEVLLQNDRIPPRCINDKGLLIKETGKGQVVWIGLESLTVSDTRTSFQMKIKDGNFSSEVKISLSEYDALKMRNRYRNDVRKFLDKPETEQYLVPDSSIHVENFINRSQKFKIEYTALGKLEQVNNKLYITPFPEEVMTTNPLIQPNRAYPVDLIYPQRRYYYSIIEIPEGYDVDFLPSPYSISNDLFELSYDAKVEGNNMIVNFAYFFKNPIYYSSEYQRIKSYFKDITKKGNEKLVIAKKP